MREGLVPCSGLKHPRWRRPPLFSRKEGSYSSRPQTQQDGGGGTRPPSSSQALPSPQHGDTHSRNVCFQAGRTWAQCWPLSTRQKGDPWGCGQQNNRPEERSLAPCHLSKVSDTLVNLLKTCHFMKDNNQARGPAGRTLGLPWAAHRKPALSPHSRHCTSRRQAGFPLRTSRMATRPGRSSVHAQLLSGSGLSHSAAAPSWRRCWTPGSAGRKGLARSGRTGWPLSHAPHPLRTQ